MNDRVPAAGNDAVADWVLGWLRRRAPEIPLGPQENFFEAGAVDSLGVIELVEAVEAEYGIRFTENDFQDRRFSSAVGIAAIVGERRAAA